jgi:hypothetical protein
VGSTPTLPTIDVCYDFFVKYLLSFVLFLSLLIKFTDKQSYAGCFPRKDIKSEFTVNPSRDCLEIDVKPGCVGNVEVSITNRCEEVYIYEKENKSYELYNHADWLNVYKSNSSAVHYFYDRDVPQDYISWERTIYEKGNPTNMVTINVINIEIRPFDIAKYKVPIYFAVITFSVFILYLLSKSIRKSSQHWS